MKQPDLPALRVCVHKNKRKKKCFPNRWEFDFGFSGAIDANTALVIYLNLVLEEEVLSAQICLESHCRGFRTILPF